MPDPLEPLGESGYTDVSPAPGSCLEGASVDRGRNALPVRYPRAGGTGPFIDVVVVQPGHDGEPRPQQSQRLVQALHGRAGDLQPFLLDQPPDVARFEAG